MDFVTGPDYPITRTYFREWRPVGATSFPMQVVHESYHPPTQELAYTQTFTVEAVRIGGVAPEEADLAIRSGMVVHDQVNDKSYVKSGPPDQHFLAAVNAARAEMGEHMKISRGDRPSSATSTRARNLLITVNAIAIGFLVIALFARKWLKGRKRQVQ
jgi:predicted phosphoribosyltransferase